MSEPKTSPILTALLVALPLLFVLAIDLTAMFEGYSFFRAISHFSFAIFCAQAICQLVLWRGEICPGQRSRLVRLNFIFALFWGVWFSASLFSNYHYILMDMMAICGIIGCISVWGQGQQEQLRNKLLLIGLIALVLGMLIYLWLLALLPSQARLQFSPFSQWVSGIILAYIQLRVAKNRLQNFIALLPLFAIFGLIANALWACALVYLQQPQLSPLMGYYSLYFMLHLCLLGFWAYPIWYKTQLHYIALLFMLELSLCLPMLLMFAH